MNQTTTDISILAEIMGSAVKDPELSNQALHEIMKSTINMNVPDAFHVLKNCAQNSGLNKPENLKEIISTTERVLSLNSPKRNYIYQTLLERDISLKDADFIVRIGTSDPILRNANTNEPAAYYTQLIETVLSKPKIAKETFEYINDSYVEKFQDSSANKGYILFLLMEHSEFNSYEKLTEKASKLTGEGRDTFHKLRKEAINKRQREINSRDY